MNPEYITFEELADRISSEFRSFSNDDQLWWSEHRIDPYVIKDGIRSRFVVATDGDFLLYFDDSEDEFAVGRHGDDQILDGRLYGELKSAVYGMMHLSQMQFGNHVESEDRSVVD